MNTPKYNTHSKFLGAVGDHNIIYQTIVSGANFVKNAAKGLFQRILSPDEDIRLRRERNQYLRKEVEINQNRLAVEIARHALEQDKFQHSVQVAHEQSMRDHRMIDLKERENQLREQENILKEQENQLIKEELECKRNFYSALIQSIARYQQSLIDIKSREIQAKWDLYNLPFYFSREETQRIFERGSGMLILFAPPLVPNDTQGFGAYLEREIEDALIEITQKFYSQEQSFHPVDFCKIFKRPIEDVEAAYVRELIVRPTLIISSTITDQKVYMTITCPIDTEADNRALSERQYRFSWNWEEVVEQLEANGKSKGESIRVIREMITILHILTIAYFSDLYYLSFDPFYVPKLPLFINELPNNLPNGLESYCSSLIQIAKSEKINALKIYADEMFVAGDFIHSSQAYKELIQLQPENTALYYNMGDSLFFLVNSTRETALVPISYYRDAAQSYWKALRSENLVVSLDNYIHAYRFAELSSELAHADGDSLRNKHEKAAFHFYTKIIDISKQYDFIDEFALENNIYNKKGKLLMDRGDYGAAYECFDEMVQKRSHDSYAWFCRAVSARELGRLKEAGISLYKISRLEKKLWENQIFLQEVKFLSLISFAKMKQEIMRISKSISESRIMKSVFESKENHK